MPFATIAGTTYDVQTDGATEGQPRPIGMRRRTWNGGVRTGEVDDIRNWTLPLAPILESQFQALRTATKFGVAVACVGDFTNGVSMSCTVDIVSATYFRPTVASPVMRLVVLAIEEAT